MAERHADELSSPPVAIRSDDGHNERRHADRRQWSRFGRERRRGERRRKTLRTVLFAAAAMSAAPSAVKFHKSFADLRPGVSVSIGSVVPLAPPEPVAPYNELIEEAASQYGIDAALIRAVMQTESNFDPRAVSPVGAMGLMQIMPALAKDLGVSNPFDPRQNVMAGAKYLSRLLEAHRGNIALTLASYNAGPTNVRRYKGIPPFKETRNYVKRITSLLEAETAD
jgi:soluble lytic murein transglycosylase-like protein